MKLDSKHESLIAEVIVIIDNHIFSQQPFKEFVMVNRYGTRCYRNLKRESVGTKMFERAPSTQKTKLSPNWLLTSIVVKDRDGKGRKGK